MTEYAIMSDKIKEMSKWLADQHAVFWIMEGPVIGEIRGRKAYDGLQIEIEDEQIAVLFKIAFSEYIN